MIIGHGDIASVLTDREDRTYFASGVSNSSETRESEYYREAELLLGQDKSKRLVYFGSLSIFYSDCRYARHKRMMENLVRKNFEHYTIIRMGNITWGENPNTLINFIRNKIRNREPFEIQDVYRYVTDKEEFLHWIDLIPDFSCELNIVGRRMKVKDIVKEYCYPWGDYEFTERDYTKQKLQACV
jgi:hypothetical protein